MFLLSVFPLDSMRIPPEAEDVGMEQSLKAYDLGIEDFISENHTMKSI